VFKTHTSSFPCVYLCNIGKVKDLKETFNIDETIHKDNIDSIICKFGFTDDIDRRLYEHQRDYGKLKNVNLELLKFTIVETKYKVEAEQELRKLFQNFNKRLIIKTDRNDKSDNNDDMNINDKNRYELVILNKNELETVFKYYRFIGNEYAGSIRFRDEGPSTEQLQNKLEKMKHEMEKQKNEFEMEKQKYEHEMESQRNKYENILLKKEIENKDEIYKLQIENLKLQLELTKK
jgi:hypothetical protein